MCPMRRCREPHYAPGLRSLRDPARAWNNLRRRLDTGGEMTRRERIQRILDQIQFWYTLKT
jgi:hypothetical protein